MVHTELLTVIGFWADGEHNARWPSPERFVDQAWDLDERETVVGYLKRGFVARSFMGFSQCRICGSDSGALELSDGVYVWPGGFAHCSPNIRFDRLRSSWPTWRNRLRTSRVLPATKGGGNRLESPKTH